jgi:hypothetical protein
MKRIASLLTMNVAGTMHPRGREMRRKNMKSAINLLSVAKEMLKRVTVSRNRFQIFGAALLAVSVLLPGAAQANSRWSATPATCMPDENDLVAPLKFKFDVDGSATFASGMSGIVTLRCNITNPQDDGTNPTGWTSAYVVYQDSSTTPNEHVRVVLHQVEKYTGTDTTEEVWNSDDYDGFPSWVAGNQGISTIFDFSVNTYYVTIYLRRTSTTATEKILHVGF